MKLFKKKLFKQKKNILLYYKMPRKKNFPRKKLSRKKLSRKKLSRKKLSRKKNFSTKKKLIRFKGGTKAKASNKYVYSGGEEKRAAAEEVLIKEIRNLINKHCGTCSPNTINLYNEFSNSDDRNGAQSVNDFRGFNNKSQSLSLPNVQPTTRPSQNGLSPLNSGLRFSSPRIRGKTEIFPMLRGMGKGH
jgi:hypothetical protein